MGLISATSCIILPCPCTIAYDTWSNMPKQPQWSKFVHSVSYVNPSEKDETEWIASILKIPIRWKAKTILLDRPHIISWKSISGVPTSGTVKFKDVTNSDTSTITNAADDNDKKCEMKLSMTVQAPKPLAMVLHTSYIRESFFRDIILFNTLKQFRDVVMADYNSGKNNNS